MSNKFEEVVKKGLLAGMGLAAITKEKAQEIAQELIKKGKTSKKDVDTVAKVIFERVQKGKEAVETKIEEGIKKVVAKMDVPTREEFQELKRMLEEIKKKIERK